MLDNEDKTDEQNTPNSENATTSPLETGIDASLTPTMSMLKVDDDSDEVKDMPVADVSGGESTVADLQSAIMDLDEVVQHPIQKTPNLDCSTLITEYESEDRCEKKIHYYLAK